MTQPVITYRKSSDKEANAMASNDLEVLDPVSPVENVMESKSGFELDRRHFFAAAMGVAAGAALLSSKSADAQQPSPNGYAQVDVINFLLNIKYLKATFYSYITQGADLPASTYVTLGTGQIFNQPAKITFSPAQIGDVFNEMYYDELNQLIALRAQQGVAVANRQTINLLGTGTTTTATTTLTQSQAIALARLLEDLSASAFAAATVYLTGTNLQLAAQALATDGLHAGLIRLISIQNNVQYQGTEFASYSSSNTSQTSLAFSAATASGSNTIYGFLPAPIAVTTGTPPNLPAVGNVLTGIGIAPGAGAVITAVTYVANATPTAIATSGSNVLTLVSSVAGLVIGQPITGTNIPAGAYISGLTSNSISISANGLPANATKTTVVTPTGFVTNGSATITGLSSTSGLIAGQPITGTGIPANTTIATGGINSTALTVTMSAPATITSLATPITGVLTSGSPIITQLSGAAGFVTGQPISGNGIPAGTTIIKVSSSSITMSNPATITTGTTSTTFTGTITSGSAVITGLSSTNGLIAGQLLTGTGIVTGTTISSISGNTLTMSANATASGTITATATTTSFTGFVTSGSKSITGLPTTTGLATGQLLVGAGIPSGTTISSISGSTVTMSAAATATSTITATGITGYLSNVITQVSSIAGFAAGQSITGTFIPTGTTITNVGTNTITISNPATSNEVSSSNISTPAPETIYAGGQLIQTTAAETVTSPTTATYTVGLSPITLAGNATVSAVSTLNVLVPDSQDVVPADPGSAATSAAGPSAVAGTNPTLYEGFFNTAGAGSTSATSTPPGFAFARTFQQVLAVLYGYNSTNSIISTQNYEGGFYPVGVTGPINSTI
jgi:hypothetical protein